MKETFDEIQRIMRGPVGSRMGMDPGKVTYTSTGDPGQSIPGYSVAGSRETIEIPEEYMAKAGARNAVEFLRWLKSL